MGVDFVIGLNWSSVQPRFVLLTVVACLLGRLCNIVPCSFVLNSCRGSSGGAKKKNGDKLEVRSQILLLVAGLRGPVAYGLAKTW
jgi:NhaP-type Na+/H+ or K+/H+ antiporter